jgi:hypothetical protein
MADRVDKHRTAPGLVLLTLAAGQFLRPSRPNSPVRRQPPAWIDR